MCAVCVCVLHLYGVAPSPAVTTVDKASRAESIGRNGLAITAATVAGFCSRR